MIYPGRSGRRPRDGRLDQPLGWRMELHLVARPSAARVGRRWVMRVVRAQRVPTGAWDVIELLTGELLANAVLHGPQAGDIGITILRSGRLVRIAVSDQSTLRPVVRAPSITAADGRGMLLIDALAGAWGVDDRGADGKTVWFSLDVGAA